MQINNARNHSNMRQTNYVQNLGWVATDVQYVFSNFNMCHFPLCYHISEQFACHNGNVSLKAAKLTFFQTAIGMPETLIQKEIDL